MTVRLFTRRPRVFVDVDGVLADDGPGIIDIINEVAGLSLTSLDFVDWDFFVHPVFQGLEGKKLVDQVWAAMGQEGRIRNLPLTYGSQDAIKHLSEFCDVHILTSNVEAPHYHHERTLWLREHFGIDRKQIIFNHQKWTERGDMIIDDRPSNCEKWIEENPEGVAVLRRTPVNRTYASKHKRLIVSSGWDAIILIAKTLATTEVKKS